MGTFAGIKVEDANLQQAVNDATEKAMQSQEVGSDSEQIRQRNIKRGWLLIISLVAVGFLLTSKKS